MDKAGVFRLSPAEKAKLLDPVVGVGGFQDLLRDLQGRIHDDTIVLGPQEMECIERYSSDYGGGGFQDRLDALLAAIGRGPA